MICPSYLAGTQGTTIFHAAYGHSGPPCPLRFLYSTPLQLFYSFRFCIPLLQHLHHQFPQTSLQFGLFSSSLQECPAVSNPGSSKFLLAAHCTKMKDFSSKKNPKWKQTYSLIEFKKNHRIS
uniref:Uncharacterized protein n=1 Tax=Lygus hesperus TaxID=30085 RepID=A0A146LP81_LYGHE